MNAQQGTLKRSLSIVDVIAIGFNQVIGSGIFLLPALVAATLGPAAILATFAAGVLSFMIALCFAEAGSHFRDTGGAYLYAHHTLGPFASFEVGWMNCWSYMASWAALANAFSIVVSRVFPVFENPMVHALGMVGLIALLVLLNYRGVKQGAVFSNLFVVAKLLPLLLFVAVGLFFISGERFVPFAPHGFSSLGEGTLVIFYAYVGFECLAIPAGEIKNPRRSVPLALFVVLALVSILYLMVQAVATGTLPNLADHKNPITSAAETFLGSTGALLIAIGVIMSITGVNASMALAIPRNLFAIAERGQMPSFFARIHPKHGTPVVALLTTALVVLALALSGSFKDLAVIAVVARFVQYIATCLAVIVLRTRETPGHERPFRLPFARAIAGASILLCVILLTQAELRQLAAGAGAAALGIPFYFWFRRRSAGTAPEHPPELD